MHAQKTLDTTHLREGKIPYARSWELKRGEGICSKGGVFQELTVCACQYFTADLNYFSSKILPQLMVCTVTARVTNSACNFAYHYILCWYYFKVFAITVGRSWNSELENCMKGLQEFLEEECDAYFVNIKKRAIKVTVINILMGWSFLLWHILLSKCQ